MPDIIHTQTAVALMRDLLSNLKKSNIACCVLRNYEFMTQGHPFDQADVDLLILASDYECTLKILSELKFSCTSESTVTYHVGFIAYPVSGFIFSLDLHIDHPSWNDIAYANGKEILSSRQFENAVPIPSNEHTLQLLTLHSILDKKEFKKKYVCRLHQLCDAPSIDETLFQILSQTFKPALARTIINHLIQQDFSGLMAMRPTIIRNLLGLRLNRWYHLFYCVLRSRWKRFKRRLLPPSLLVAFMGPDGAGKTTAIHNVCEALRTCGIGIQQFYMGRWHSHILPLDRVAIKHGTSQQFASHSNPTPLSKPAHADPVRIAGRPIYRMVRDGIYLLEMFLRYALRLHPAMKRRGIVFTDRYAYDLLLDPNATWFLRFLVPMLYPRPHLCFLLYHKPEELHQRKTEQSLDEIRRQTTLYHAYQDRLSLIPILSDDPQRVAHSITQTILFAFYQKL